ncbi:MAG: MarR family transcriptional regulator [Rhodococcus sp. (in: high G+C Gram-positive bacteria)]
MTPTEPTHRGGGADRLLSALERAVSERMRLALEPEGLDLEEWRVLSFLSDGDGHTMADTAEFALLPPPTLTKVVNRLVSNNLVHRRTGTVDRRQVLIRTTARGQRKFEDVAGVVESVHRALFASDAAREAFETVLSTALDNATSSPASVDH